MEEAQFWQPQPLLHTDRCLKKLDSFFILSHAAPCPIPFSFLPLPYLHAFSSPAQSASSPQNPLPSPLYTPFIRVPQSSTAGKWIFGKFKNIFYQKVFQKNFFCSLFLTHFSLNQSLLIPLFIPLLPTPFSLPSFSSLSSLSSSHPHILPYPACLLYNCTHTRMHMHK